MSLRLPPTFIPTIPSSQPLMTLPIPKENLYGGLPTLLSKTLPLVSMPVKWTIGLAMVIAALAANTGLTQQAPSSHPPVGTYVVSAHVAQAQASAQPDEHRPEWLVLRTKNNHRGAEHHHAAAHRDTRTSVQKVEVLGENREAAEYAHRDVKLRRWRSDDADDNRAQPSPDRCQCR